MVAYSDDMNDENETKANNCGFDLIQAVPLTATIFDRKIIPLILMR